MENKDTNLMNWDDTLENDGQEYILLPEGDYDFTVTACERGRFPGGQKIPACNKASLTLRVDSWLGIALVKTDLLLYRTVEWKLCAFFRSIGQKKYGEKAAMSWDKVVGSRGRAHIRPREYEKDGQVRHVNDVERFIDSGPDPDDGTAAVKEDGLPW